MTWHRNSQLANEADRRRGPRFRCSGRAQLRLMLWSGAPASGKISDLSLGGCLIETDFPFAPGTLAEISLVINGVPIHATTQVRHLYGHSGVGLEFTRLTRRSLTALDELVRELATRQEIVTPGIQLAAPHIAGTMDK